MNQYFCELALVDGRVQERVLLTVSHGRFEAVEVGASQGSGGAVVLRGITIPGMANTHSHAFHRALRSRTQRDHGSFWTWRELMYAAAERLDPVNYHRLARATFAEMTLAGITSVGEFHYVHHRPDGRPYQDPNAMGDALLAAASEVGIRITLLDTLYIHGGLGQDGHLPPEGVQARYSDQTAEDWIERVDRLSPGPNQRVGAAIHSVRAVDPAAMKQLAEWSEDRGAVVHAHVSEQRAENDQCLLHYGMTPVALLQCAGVLTERFTAVHATHLTANDVQLLAASRSTVCMCPTTERDLGDGIGPSADLTGAGVPLTLGSDSHAIIDHFEECRAVELNERLRAERRGIHTAPDLLSMALDGHASIGWDDVGRITVGSRADCVAVSGDSVRTAGGSGGAGGATATETLVFAATASDVTDVIIDGDHIVRDGQHKSLNVAAELNASIHALLPPT